jgi:hypothetical protein
MPFTRHFLYVGQHAAQSLSEEWLVVVARIGRHLTEELMLSLFAFWELRILITLWCHATNAEMGIPSLFANFELSVSHITRICHNLLRSTSSTATRLVNEEDGIAFFQENVAPTLASVRC